MGGQGAWGCFVDHQGPFLLCSSLYFHPRMTGNKEGCKLGGASQTYLHLTELTQAWRSSWRQERRFIVLPGVGSAVSAWILRALSSPDTLGVCVCVGVLSV